MFRKIAALAAAASTAGMAWAQTAPPPSAATGAVSTDPSVFTLGMALSAGGVADDPAVPQVTSRPDPNGGDGNPLPSVDAANAGVSAASAARRVAGLRPNPEIQAQVENVAGTGAFRGLRQSETTVGLALPIELGGKRPARVALATARLTKAQILVQVARADLRLRITQLYIEAVAAERRSMVLGEQAAIAADNFRIARDRVDIGDIGPIEQQRADVQRINAQVAADNAARQAQAARANLSALLGRPIVGSLDGAWFDRVEGYGPPAPIAVEGTLALVAAEADVRTADAQVRLARSLRIPDVTVSLGARRLQATRDTAAVIGLSIPLPLFNNGSAYLAQARAERTQAGALRNLALADLRLAIESAQAEVANAAAAARAAGGPALAAAQEAARIARIGWTQGKFDQIALLDAERTLSQTRQTYVDALAAYHDARARLDRLTTPAPTVSGDYR